jgi:hypothetical protein
VQTRMLRGVGGGRSNPPAYPISWPWPKRVALGRREAGLRR